MKRYVVISEAREEIIVEAETPEEAVEEAENQADLKFDHRWQSYIKRIEEIGSEQ
jgi:hypothetical protein